ncbi:MAG: T9SS type A sorting domain-containing protein, partial [Phaeodactylibacter sp.]|nr:T9SS type A sorting domain-containing protein [Phaeodactylibacter sp.]
LALYPGIYTLIATVNGCASAPFELEVPLIGQPVVTIEEDTIFACPGEPLFITAGGNATHFTWYSSNSDTPIGSGQSITVDPEDGVIYRVTGFNDFGCGGFDEVVVLIPFDPAISADTSGVLCPGTTVTLSASEGEQFLWSTGDTTASITVSPDQSSLYYLEITGSNGCVARLSAAVSVASSAGIFISPGAAICEGEAISLFAGGGDISWSTGDSVSTISVSPLQTTTYVATITTSLGCVFLRETTVTVSPAPAIELAPADTSYLCQGDSLQLLAYESDTLIYENWVAPTQSTHYTLPGATDYGCREIGGFTVIVNPLPLLSIDGQGLLCSSDSVLLAANSNGSLSWSTGEDSDSIYVFPVGTQTYSVTATDANGCSRTDSVQVTQAAPPDAPQVSCTSSLGKVIFSWVVEPGLTYGLSHLEGPAGAPLGNNQYIVTGLLPGQAVRIELDATNAAGCTATSPASCSAADCSVVSLYTGAPDRVCSSSGPVPLTALVTGGTGNGVGEWTGPGVDDATDTFHPSIAGAGQHELIYTYTDAGCTVNDTLHITVEQALETAMVTCEASPTMVIFSWPVLPQDTGYQVTVLTGQDGDFIGPTTYAIAGLSTGEAVTIKVTALGIGACGQTTVSSSCLPTGCPMVEVSSDTMICPGSSIQLSVETEGWDTFEWSPASSLSCADCPNPYAFPSFTTTYTLIAGNAAGCADTVAVTVYVGEIPDSYIPDGPLYFCEGEPLEICLPETGLPFWVGPNAFISTEQCLAFENATADIAGPYYAILRTNGCRFSKRFVLEPAPPIEVRDISGFQAACPDEPFTLYVEASNAVSYSWSPAEYLDCPTCPVTEGRVPQTATFTVEMTDSYGCTATDIATVFIDACPARPTAPATGAPATAAALRFYPNPASNRVQLELPGEGVKTVQLWSSSGKLVREISTSGQAYTLPLQSVPGGAYLLRMVSEKEARTGWLVVRE